MRDLSEYKKSLQDILEKSNKVLITMSSPDGDSVGSSLALKFILESMGKKVNVISSFDLAGRFPQYTNSSSIIIADLGRIDFSTYDVCFTIDAGHITRLVKSELYPDGFKFPKTIDVVNIDHHISNNNFGTLNINITDASCTAEVIDALFSGMYELDSYISTLYYFSIVYDTGNFRFGITDHLFEFALKCIKSGADTALVLDDFFNNKALKQIKYQAVLLERLEKQNNYIYTKAIHDDITTYELDVAKYLSATAEVARDFLVCYKDVDFGWVISERKHNIIKVEMRAKHDNTPILDITTALGGGGHKRACGAKIINKSIDEVQDFILKYLTV